jgi:hypothetical protein
VEVYAANKYILTRAVDPKIPLHILDAPGDLIEKALVNGV